MSLFIKQLILIGDRIAFHFTKWQLKTGVNIAESLVILAISVFEIFGELVCNGQARGNNAFACASFKSRTFKTIEFVHLQLNKQHF